MSAKVNLKDHFQHRVNGNFAANPTDTLYGVDISEIPDIKFATDCFVSMVGGVYDFFGMDLNHIKLNGMVFEFLEDPDDGYRSHLGAVRIPDNDHKAIFFRSPIAQIKICLYHKKLKLNIEPPEDFIGYYLEDISDGHIWALIGTGNTLDYYPFFVCKYRAKPPER